MAAQQKWLNGRVNGYTAETLENNWNEERFDIKYLKDSKPLPSQYGHFYDTTYQDLCSNKAKINIAPEDAVKAAKNRIPGFPGHQPEMDSEYYKQRTNTYETDHRVNYLDPRLKMFPFDLKKMMTDDLKAKGREIHHETPTANFLLTDLSRVRATPAPVVQLDRVFSSEPERRIYKTLSSAQLKPDDHHPREDQSTARRPKTHAVSRPTESGDDLSNFERLMISINKKKTSGGGESSESATQKQQQEQQPPQQEPAALIATEKTLEREKTAKTVRWQENLVETSTTN